MFYLSCVCYAFLRVCLYVPFGHLNGKDCPLGSRLWCLTVSLLLSIGILGQVWYLIVSIPDLCALTYWYLIVSIPDLCALTYFSFGSIYILVLHVQPRNRCGNLNNDLFYKSYTW